MKVYLLVQEIHWHNYCTYDEPSVKTISIHKDLDKAKLDLNNHIEIQKKMHPKHISENKNNG